MGIFGGGGNNQGPGIVSNIRVTQSCQGRCVPVVMGTGRIQQSLLWTDGLINWKMDTGGKKGGGKGNSQFLYAADVIGGLCNGPVEGIGSVWDGQTWLAANAKNDNVSVTSTYTPAHAVLMVADNGVVFATVYSATYTDVGAPASTVLIGTDYAPLTGV